MSIASQKRLVRPENPENSLPSWINPMHSKELHHFCTVSSPIFALFGKQPVANQQLTIQNCTIASRTPHASRLPRRNEVQAALWTLDFGLWTPLFCTVSAPFLHRFSHDRGNGPLIIKHLRKKLHRDILSHPFAASRPAQLPLRFVRGEGSRVRCRRLLFHPQLTTNH